MDRPGCGVSLAESPLPRCRRPGVGVSLPCPAGRPDATAGPYCDEHGGLARAQSEAERDWNYVAPASVGDVEAVQSAGCASLDSTCAYLVLREEHGRWLAWLGLGSHMMPVHSPRARPMRRKRGERKDEHAARAALGGCAFDSREVAESEARSAWRQHVYLRVESIRAARGGTLGWGVPVAPLADPHVIDANDRNAWDVADEVERSAPRGLAGLSGVRPSGEPL
jgi:hypothetical protein